MSFTKLKPAFLCLAFLVALSFQAKSATFELVGTQIVLNGEIRDGDGASFRRFMRVAFDSGKVKEPIDEVMVSSSRGKEKPKVVRLASQGGLTAEAIQIGHEIKRMGLDTYVPAGNCYSSCALIWLAGKKKMKHPTAKVGFHNSYDKKTKRSQGNAMVGFYLAKMGYTYDTALYVTEKSYRTLRLLKHSQMRKAGIYFYREKLDIDRLEPGRIPVPVFRGQGPCPVAPSIGTSNDFNWASVLFHSRSKYGVEVAIDAFYEKTIYNREEYHLTAGKRKVIMEYGADYTQNIGFVRTANEADAKMLCDCFKKTYLDFCEAAKIRLPE